MKYSSPDFSLLLYNYNVIINIIFYHNNYKIMILNIFIYTKYSNHKFISGYFSPKQNLNKKKI